MTRAKTGDLSNLARRRARRRISRLHDRRFRGNGRARCGESHSGDASERSRLPLELQGRQMRLLFSGNQRHAEVDVHDAAERSVARKTGHRSADEGVSRLEGFDHRCVVEFSREEKNQEVQTAPARCARWNMADAAGRTSIACRNSANASSAFSARMSVTFCAIITCTINLLDRVS